MACARAAGWLTFAYIPLRSSRVIYSKKYGVDLIRFTHSEDTVICASKNQWDGAHSKTFLERS